MKQACELFPWKVTDISVYPYGSDYWSMNPSIHLDKDGSWLCVTRIVDYCMPDGRTLRSKNARSTGQQTKNAMVVLDPASWRPIQIYKMHEKDGLPRASTLHVGYEDMRIFRTDKGGLQGIAASLHLHRETHRGAPHNQPPEQVLLSFDGEYNIVDAWPIRGDEWSGTPQKNWVPFDHCTEARFLYSIDKGTLFDEVGSVHGERAVVIPSIHSRPTSSPSPVIDLVLVPPSSMVTHEVSQVQPPAPPKLDRKLMIRSGSGVQVVRGRRISLDASASRPSAYRSSRSMAPRREDESIRMMDTGRVHLPKYGGLRGGTQLVHVRDDTWLGIGHEMKFVSGKKYYWHVWYTVDAGGKMTSVSEPMKLAPNGIEFAAGIAIDGDRLVVSFGVDDMECKVGETRLSAVMDMLRTIAR